MLSGIFLRNETSTSNYCFGFSCFFDDPSLDCKQPANLYGATARQQKYY